MNPRKSDDIKSHKREMKDDNKIVIVRDENEKRNGEGNNNDAIYKYIKLSYFAI